MRLAFPAIVLIALFTAAGCGRQEPDRAKPAHDQAHQRMGTAVDKTDAATR
jgi:predicted small lipoprotein YifL